MASLKSQILSSLGRNSQQKKKCKIYSVEDGECISLRIRRVIRKSVSTTFKDISGTLKAGLKQPHTNSCIKNSDTQPNTDSEKTSSVSTRHKPMSLYRSIGKKFAIGKSHRSTCPGGESKIEQVSSAKQERNPSLLDVSIPEGTLSNLRANSMWLKQEVLDKVKSQEQSHADAPNKKNIQLKSQKLNYNYETTLEQVTLNTVKYARRGRCCPEHPGEYVYSEYALPVESLDKISDDAGERMPDNIGNAAIVPPMPHSSVTSLALCLENTGCEDFNSSIKKDIYSEMARLPATQNPLLMDLEIRLVRKIKMGNWSPKVYGGFQSLMGPRMSSQAFPNIWSAALKGEPDSLDLTSHEKVSQPQPVMDENCTKRSPRLAAASHSGNVETPLRLVDCEEPVDNHSDEAINAKILKVNSDNSTSNADTVREFDAESMPPLKRRPGRRYTE
jgi:hypothetical protein